MHALDIINQRFIAPLKHKKTGTVGVELEFPMLNLEKQPVDRDIADGLLAHFLENGFTVAERTTDGKPAFLENADGDVLSFDNSYNNFEFSMQYGDDLLAIKKRFDSYIRRANTYLAQFHYLITGMGTNPYKQYIRQDHVSYPVYNMVDQFLHQYQNETTHAYPDFPAYLSSVQTHLDITPCDVPRAVTLFSKIGFARVMLFGNSIGLQGEKVLCYRDYLWENSAFGQVPNITGKLDREYVSLLDIAESFLDRGMFNRIRDGEYQVFDPIPLKAYFEQPEYGAQAEDIAQFLSFRDVEVTARGTVEVRGDCTQPVQDAFLPPAFNLGLACNLDKAVEFTAVMPVQGTNTENRNKAIHGQLERDMVPFLTGLTEIAIEGLEQRGKGEEALLLPLLERARQGTCPAKETLELLEKGTPIEEIIRLYSQ